MEISRSRYIGGLALIAACQTQNRPPRASAAEHAVVPPPAATAAPGIAATYACPDSLRIYALFGNDSAGHPQVALAINDDRLHLPQLASASGARYGDSTVTFWIKGDSVTWEQDGGVRHCAVIRS